MSRPNLLRYIISRHGRDIDKWETPTADVSAATAEAIDLLGLPPDIELRLKKEGRNCAVSTNKKSV